jgi:flagellar hook-associated protein 2
MVTATTSTTSNAAITAASGTPTGNEVAKTAAAGLIKALGSGSGVDVNSLATSLVAAEKAPRKAELDAKVAKAEGGISGYSAVKYVLGDLQTAFTNLKNESSFNTLVPQISQPNAISVTTSASASAGNHTVSVTQLAQQQRSISADNVAGFANPLSQVNGGLAFSLVLKNSIDPTPTKVFNLGNGAASTSTITFKAMNKGDTVTVNGLTLTANKSLNASEVGELFGQLDTTTEASVAAGGVAASAINSDALATFGTFSGLFATGYSSGVNNNGVVILTSTANNTADIASPTGTQFSNTIAVADTATTPAGIVAAINSASLGIKAQLINTGNIATPYRIMVTGASGVSNAFSLTSLKAEAGGGEVTGISFGKKLQSSQDATFNVDGMDMTSSKNTVTDAIAGTTLSFNSITTAGVPANLVFSRDNSSISTKLNALVTAYNDANTMLGVVSDPKSTVETFGATLVGNSMVGSVRNQMRQLITGNSTTPAGGLTALRDIGFNLDQKGVLSLDKTKLASALNNSFDNVVTLVTGNRENQSKFSVLPSGVAGEAVKKLSALLDTTAPLTTQSTNLTTKISEYKKQLSKLDIRMTDLLARYNKQFATMESMVGESKSMQTSLKSTFDGMMASYTNN